MTVFLQGWEFAHSLIAHLLICSFAQIPQVKWATVSDSLRSLMTNEWLWANRSGRSTKWANCSFFLSELLIRSFAHKKLRFTQKNLTKIVFFVGFLNEQFTHSLFFNEWCEWIAQVAHQKWAMWANCSSRSPKMSDHERLAQVAHQKWAN